MGETHLRATLREVEREHILSTLTLCEGNRTRAAETLGISVRCLRNKLRDYVESGFQVQMPKSGLGQPTFN
jgi:DNA-binding NtrC family response regulator